MRFCRLSAIPLGRSVYVALVLFLLVGTCIAGSGAADLSNQPNNSLNLVGSGSSLLAQTASAADTSQSASHVAAALPRERLPGSIVRYVAKSGHAAEFHPVTQQSGGGADHASG